MDKFKIGDIVELRGQFGPPDAYVTITDVTDKALYFVPIVIDNPELNNADHWDKYNCVIKKTGLYYKQSIVLKNTIWNILYG